MAGGIRTEHYRTVENLYPIFEILEHSLNVGAKEEALRILAHISAEKECRSALRHVACSIVLPESSLCVADRREDSASWSVF